MPAKIKANDDRIQVTAIAVLLLARERMGRAQAYGLITPSLADFRDDYAGYKTAFPTRTWDEAKDGSPLTNKARRKDYFKLVNAMDTVLGRIKRNKTSFSSLQELDNYLASSLKAFD
ncbi:MAG: hypothetical protein HOH58_02060 [Opitutaceae bacterium]|jgi:hypothetical protein|nr:hypothetical protein [Opitutaceae bacterium]